MAKKKRYTVMLGVMLDPKTLSEIQQVTDENEISKSEYVRDLIEKELNHKQSIKGTEQ